MKSSPHLSLSPTRWRCPSAELHSFCPRCRLSGVWYWVTQLESILSNQWTISYLCPVATLLHHHHHPVGFSSISNSVHCLSIKVLCETSNYSFFPNKNIDLWASPSHKKIVSIWILIFISRRWAHFLPGWHWKGQAFLRPLNSVKSEEEVTNTACCTTFGILP